jgi:hypothetical protein
MPLQVVLPFEGVAALGALIGSLVLVDRRNMVLKLGWLGKELSADVTLFVFLSVWCRHFA